MNPPPGPGRFQPIGELGRGGLGRVVEALDTEIGRTVALKLLVGGAPLDVVERFRREGRLTGRLEHPNIVPVYDVGTMPSPGGGVDVFHAMKKITGRHLGAVIRSVARREDGAWTQRRLVEAFRDVCRAIAYAHSRGVIHRDLKPANVMVGEFGEVLVVDWGLAKERGERAEGREGGSASALSPSRPSALTLDGDVMGTPEYMPPEQAAGRMEDVDERSDVFALGAILYEILAFRPPYEGTDAKDALERAQSGFVTPPSSLPEAPPRSAAARPAPGSVPPELEKICMKALAPRREDRFPSARELHDEIQAFLEGALERERREREARERVEAGRRHAARYGELREEIEAQRRRVLELARLAKSYEPVEKKRGLWEAEARLRGLREARIEAFAQADSEFGQALAVDPGSAEAREGKCGLHYDRCVGAEERRDREEGLLNRRLLAAHDVEGTWLARLDAPGRLSIRTFEYGCGCLRPAAGLRAAYGEEPAVPFREGRARPDLPLEDRDHPVPVSRISPAWGHTAACARREVAGVEVRIARYEERDRRRVPGEERVLGVTPIVDVELPQGSWLCTLRSPDPAHLAPVLLPVRIDRGGRWEQNVNLYRVSDVPEGFAYVPGGPFTFGGLYAGGETEEVRRTEDLFVAAAPVTCGEYAAFLNALAGEEARKRQPREGTEAFFREGSGGFEPRAGEPGALLSSPDLPVVGISWFDAVAFAAWESAREGRPYRLLHDDEFEKSARGVDGRVYPWGDEVDDTFGNWSGSNEGGPRLAPPGQRPVDRSPYGISDLAGNCVTWCWNAPEKPWRAWCVLRGGGWPHSPPIGRTAFKQGTRRATVYRFLGARLCVSPLAEPAP